MRVEQQKGNGLGTRTAVGALVGGLGGALLLGIGLARAKAAQTPIPAGDDPLQGLYIISATASGALGGALYPLAKKKTGAVLVGLVAILPFMLGVSYIAEDRPESWTSRIVVSAIMTVIFGPIVGLKWIRSWHSDT